MDRRTSQKTKKPITVSVIGLGKLGSCYAAFCASRGFNVIGTDLDVRKVISLNQGIAPISEPGLQGYINAHKKRLNAVHGIEEAVRLSSATFIIVPTPSRKDGIFSVDAAVAVCKKIGAGLRGKRGYHTVVLVSTVLPEDCRAYLIPALENASGKRCGPDFGFCYSPSLIAIGDVLQNLENPDFLFLGAFDKRSRTALSKIYERLYPKLSPEHMSIESAELAKIALNSYITMKITFANTLGMLCEKIPEAHVDHITTALGKDKRIGSHYIKSGLGFGGPCFPRDNTAFSRMAERRGIRTPLAIATDEFNKGMPKKLAHLLEKFAAKNRTKRIGFLGVSYKPRTTLAEESQARFIAEEMRNRGYKISIYEPLGSEEARAYFKKGAQYPKTLAEFLAKSDVIFVSNKDSHFHTIKKLLKKNTKPKVIVDPWGMFAKSDFKSPVVYHAIGR